MLSLINKHIILGITGGIAAYKSAELCRLLKKAGAEVRVVMTAAACEFITPLTMQALSGQRVHRDLLDEDAEAAMGHIELARWADLILVAPASANFMKRLAHGEASDLLSTLCLASKCPIAIAPAMNQEMWAKQSTQEHLGTLQQKQVHVLGPAEGEQACGDVGPGRMLEPQAICEAAAAFFLPGSLAGVNVCITAGPTREAIDPVRYLSNRSSGKMGFAIAQAAVEAGAHVTLVSGPVALQPPAAAKLLAVESAEQMLAACMDNPCDIFIGVAAVADYRPVQAQTQKIKKSASTLSLELERNPDILASIAGLKEKPFCVGFAAETENLEQYALAKLKEKNLDMIVANLATETFSQDDASISVYWSGNVRKFEPLRKSLLARELVALISELYSARTQA